MSLLEVRDLTRSYYGVHALRGVDLSVEAGRITGLIGPNGAGKTTLFNCISGLVPPDAGSVRSTVAPSPAGGRSHHRAPGWCGHSRSRAAFRGCPCWRTCCCTARGSRANVWCTRCCARPLGAAARSGTARTRGGDRAAAEPHARAGQRAAELSGGQKKLLEIGRALMAEPQLLLLDEPVAGVNPALAREIGEHLRGLVADGISVLLIEHHMDTIAALCDPVIVMAEGRHLRQGRSRSWQRIRWCRRRIWDGGMAERRCLSQRMSSPGTGATIRS